MRSRLLILLSLTFAALALAGCTIVTGSGNIESEERPVGEFNALALSGSGVVTFEQGDGYSLVVEADDNVLEWIETEVNGDTLEIGFRPGINIVNPSQAVQVRITAPSLEEIEISGSGSVRADQIVNEQFRSTVSGSGEIEIDNLTAADVRIVISGSGEVQVTGAAQAQEITLSGSGDYKAEDLASQSASINISGSGSAVVWVAESLDVNVSGSGDVAYYGNPSIDQRTTGSGRINSLGDK